MDEIPATSSPGLSEETSAQLEQQSPPSSPITAVPPYIGPAYVPPVPYPIISGYLEKSGDGKSGSKGQSWLKRYVEVSEGTLRYFDGRDVREETGVVVPLADSFVSIQGRRHVRLESKSGVRVFRAPTEARAYHWVYVISRYCNTAPTGEGFCKKMSGGKGVMEDRYIRLSADGLLSWYKSEKEDSESRGAIQVRGEQIVTNPDDTKEIWVETKDRKYIFSFMDTYDATEWTKILIYHSYRQPLTKTATSIRNKAKKENN